MYSRVSDWTADNTDQADDTSSYCSVVELHTATTRHLTTEQFGDDSDRYLRMFANDSNSLSKPKPRHHDDDDQHQRRITVGLLVRQLLPLAAAAAAQ